MAIFKKIYYRALFFDDKGEFLGIKKIKYNSTNFELNKKSYIFNPSASCFINDNWYFFNEKRYYFYNVNNPEPLNLIRNYVPILTSNELNTFIDTEVLRKLNDLAKKNWIADLLTPTNIIIGLVIIGLLYWFFQIKGGHL